MSGAAGNADRDAAIVAMHDNGRLSMTTVAVRFGMTRQRVHQILNKAGVKSRSYGALPREVYQHRLDRYAAALAEGMRPNEAAKSIGLKYFAIRESARAIGVKLPRNSFYINRADRIVKFYVANPQMCAVDVARHFGVDPTEVSRALNRAGVPSRRRWRKKRPANQTATDHRVGA